MFIKKIIFLIFCTVFVVAATFSQKMTLQSSLLFKRKAASGLLSVAYKAPAVRPLLSPAFYASNLAFFCRQELKFEKITKIPFRFRLGSVAQCDRLEGKRLGLTE